MNLSHYLQKGCRINDDPGIAPDCLLDSQRALQTKIEGLIAEAEARSRLEAERTAGQPVRPNKFAALVLPGRHP